MKQLLVLVATLAVVYAEVASYDGYQVWEVRVQDRTQVEKLRQLERDGHIEIAKAISVDGPGMVIVSPEKFKKAKVAFAMAGITASVHIENIQEGIDREMERLRKRYEIDPYSYDSGDFNSYDAIIAQINTWISKCPSGLDCKSYSIGKTYENRDLRVIHFSKTGSNNRVLWFESVIHSREWLALATTQNMVDHIVDNYGQDSEVTSMLGKYDFYFLLVANPDGYVHTFRGSSSRLWRKNRRPNPLGICLGTDLNRNFDTMWGKEGANPSECSETYPGRSAASEPTTQKIQEALVDLKSKKQFAAMFAVHCFGKMWMFPHSHTKNHAGRECVRSKDHADLSAVVAKGRAALEAKEGNYGWRTGTICEVIYAVTGSVADYMYEKGVKYSFAMELRGDWFVVDKNQIKPSFREYWAGLVASTAEMARIEGWN